MASAQATIVEDLKDKRIPSALYWTTEHVADWIEELGFPQYKINFESSGKDSWEPESSDSVLEFDDNLPLQPIFVASTRRFNPFDIRDDDQPVPTPKFLPARKPGLFLKEEMSTWIQGTSFFIIKACILTNLINGRKLCRLHASAFPKIGITDFEHIKIISKNIRDLLFLEEPYWNRSIAVPPKNNLGMYLEMKSHTGKQIDTTTFRQMYHNNPDPKWQPPLSNQCLILPRD